MVNKCSYMSTKSKQYLISHVGVYPSGYLKSNKLPIVCNS